MKLVTALLLPHGPHTVPTEVVIDVDDIGSIHRAIDCDIFACINSSIDLPNEPFTAVGFFDDEFLFRDWEAMDVDPINYHAAVLFQSATPLLGNVLVVNGTNPQGVYDGESYDLPAEFLSKEVQAAFLYDVVKTYVRYHETLRGLNIAKQRGMLTSEEIVAAAEASYAGDDDPIGDLVSLGLNMAIMDITEESETIDDTISKLLGE